MSLFNEHISKYEKEPTAGEIYWMQGRLLSDAKMYHEAIGSFLKVPITHPRASSAVHEAAKCCRLMDSNNRNVTNSKLVELVNTVNERVAELSQLSPNPNADVTQAELVIIDLKMKERTG